MKDPIQELVDPFLAPLRAAQQVIQDLADKMQTEPASQLVNLVGKLITGKKP